MSTDMRAPRTPPRSMNTDRYVYDVDVVDGQQAWKLFEASRDGDVATVRRLLAAAPQLVHAQYWYTQPLHFAVYADQAEVVRTLLDAGAEPGRVRFCGGWNDLLKHAAVWGFDETHALLDAELRRRYRYRPEFAALVAAIRSRDAAQIDTVLRQDPELARASDVAGNGAVHWAAMTRQPELFLKLIALGADLDHRRSDGQTPAHIVLNGDYEFRVYRDLRDVEHPDGFAVVRALLHGGATCDLSVACALGDTERVDATLNEDLSSAGRLDSGRRRPLSYAARFGRVDVVRRLLEAGADPNRPEELAPRGAALFEACSAGHRDVVELLLDAGADPDAESDSSGVCVSIARHRGHANAIVELLRARGAAVPLWELSVDDMLQALASDEPDDAASGTFGFALEALTRNDMALVERLLERYPDVARQLHGGCLRLGSADVAIRATAVLERLLDAGLDPDRAGWLGKTPLHHFAGRGEVANVQSLLDRGAAIDALDDQYRGTPLAWAAAEGHAETVALLLERGADPGLPHDVPAARPATRARSAGHSISGL